MRNLAVLSLIVCILSVVVVTNAGLFGNGGNDFGVFGGGSQNNGKSNGNQMQGAYKGGTFYRGPKKENRNKWNRLDLKTRNSEKQKKAQRTKLRENSRKRLFGITKKSTAQPKDLKKEQKVQRRRIHNKSIQTFL